MCADFHQFVQLQDLFLAGSGISTTDTTIVLKSMKFAVSNDTVVMADFGDTGYGVLEPGTAREENISFTGITQNGDGTATLTGVTRGLDFAAPYTNVAALQKSHAGNSLFRISNSAPFYNELGAKDNDETVTGTWTFTNPQYPKMDSAVAAPTDDEQLATKKYVDDTAGGTPVSINRIVVAATAGATITDGDCVYLDETDNEWKLADASATATSENVQLGIAQGAGTDGNAITGGVLLSGRDNAQSGFSAGDAVFISDTAGTLSNSAGTKSVQVGQAVSATEVDFTPSYYKSVATADEKAAMAGTSGTPSTSNKFVTNDDTSATSSASKLIRANASGDIADEFLNLTIAGDTVYSDGADLTRLPIGTAGQVYTVNSGATAPEWATAGGDLIDSDSTATTVANTASETSLYSVSIPANTLGSANAVMVDMDVSSYGALSGDTQTFRLKYGSTTVATFNLTVGAANITTTSGRIIAKLFGDGGTSAQSGSIRANIVDPEAETTANASHRLHGYASGTAAEDSTGALTLDITIDSSGTSATNTITVRNVIVQTIKA